MKDKIGNWFNKHWNDIICHLIIGAYILAAILSIAFVIGGVISFFTTLTADIPAWLKWQLLTR